MEEEGGGGGNRGRVSKRGRLPICIYTFRATWTRVTGIGR